VRTPSSAAEAKPCHPYIKHAMIVVKIHSRRSQETQSGHTQLSHRFEHIYLGLSGPPAIWLVERLYLECDSCPVSITPSRGSQQDCHAWASVDRYLLCTTGKIFFSLERMRCRQNLTPVEGSNLLEEKVSRFSELSSNANPEIFFKYFSSNVKVSIKTQ